MSDRNVGRRSVIAALSAGVAAGTSGCIEETRSLVGRDEPTQIQVSIKTTPADADPRGIRIARFLAKRLNAVGIDARVVPMERVELQRQTLIRQEFDLYVERYPGSRDPDALRPLLHSRFGTESGWQNPFGYANLAVDDLLTTQKRQSGAKRVETLEKIQHAIARDQPFAVVAFPDNIRATRMDYDGWTNGGVHSPLGYLRVTPRDGGHGDRLRMTTMDARPTENLNPLAAEFRSDGTLVGLLYDQIGRRIDGEVRSWLGSWTWQSSGPKPVAEVRLRDDCWWHDETPLTAGDVAFTYEFLQDTAMDTQESPVPSPQYRGASSLVRAVEVRDDRTVRVEFRAASPEVAVQAFTIPILPKHVWQDKCKRADIAGVDAGSTTKALVWPNMKPVGSGPLAFASAEPRESLTFERFDRHFLHGLDDEKRRDVNNNGTSAGAASEPEHVQRFAGGFSFDTLQFVLVPSSGAATQLVLNSEADGTATGVTADEVRKIGHAESVELHVDSSHTMYHVGFNARKSPFSNVRFRRAVARLLDKEHLVASAFGGYAKPAASPLARHDALAPNLTWRGEDPKLPFPGDDGKLDVGRAKTAFKKAGYRYTNSGKLLRR